VDNQLSPLDLFLQRVFKVFGSRKQYLSEGAQNSSITWFVRTARSFLVAALYLGRFAFGCARISTPATQSARRGDPLHRGARKGFLLLFTPEDLLHPVNGDFLEAKGGFCLTLGRTNGKFGDSLQSGKVVLWTVFDKRSC
jgi:hypothetical protein